MYTVIGGLASRTFRVIWMLEELGQPYEHRSEAPHSEAVCALNPSGKIPLLLVGDAVLNDSTAILHHLADRHGALAFPAGSLERARQDALTFTLLDTLEGVLWTASKHSFVLPEERRVPAAKESLRWEFARNAATFEAGMG
ncbi:MAG: glutathione S-transferase, partial [Alphaproteobacteria bacterium HGW-Alphaproteobacteria-2]